MVAIVGSTAWQETKSWPAGTQVGHLAVLTAVPTLPWFTPAVRGWQFQGWAFGPSSFLSTPIGAPVWVKTLTSADVSAPPPDEMGQVAVLSGVPRVLSVMQGSSVTAPAGGGVLAVAVSPLPISGGDVSWLTEFVSPTLGRARMGWVDTPAQRNVSVPAPSQSRPLMLVLARPDAPLAPKLVRPVNGDVSVSEPLTLEWTHSATVPGGSQSHYALSVTTTSQGQRWWNGGAWTTSETWVAGSAQQVTLPAAALIANEAHSWTVRTREAADGRNSPLSEAGAFTPVVPPSMTLTGPASPVMDDLSPTVTWTRSTPRGMQTAFQIQWADAGGRIVADSGVVQSSATSWTAPAESDWVRGTTYTVTGHVWQAGGSVSPVATRSVVMNWTPPPTPVVGAGTRYTPWTEQGRNFANTPSFEVGGAPVTVVTNLWSDPLPNGVGLANGQARWLQNTSNVPVSITDGWAHAEATASGVSDATIVRSSVWGTNALPVAGSTLYRLSFEMDRKAGLPDAVASRWEYSASGTILANDVNMSLQTDGPTGRRFVEFTTHADTATVVFVLRRLSTPWQIGDWYRVRNTMLAVPILSPGTFVGVGVSNDPDLSGVWVGTAHQSATWVQGTSLPGVNPGGNAVVIRSGWGTHGSYSARIIPNNPTNGDSYAELAIPVAGTLRENARVIGRLLLDGPQGTPGQHARARRIVAFSPELRGDQAANTAGLSSHDLTWSDGVARTQARFYNGAARGQGQSWWDQVGIFHASYTGGWFDGDTLPTGLDPTLWRVRWLGTPGNSQSVLESRSIIPQSEHGIDVEVSGLTPGNPVTVQRLLASGDWVDVLRIDAAVTSAFVVTDPWGEFGHAVQWRANQSSQLEGVGMVSDWGVSAPVVSMDDRSYLADAAAPLLTWIEVSIRTDDERTERQNRQVSYGLGDPFATVWTDPAQGMSGSAVLVTDTADDRRALHDLIDKARTLCWRESPENEDRGMPEQPPTKWMAVTTPWVQQRHAQLRWSMRNIPVSWVEQPVTQIGASFAPVTHHIQWL